LYDISMPIRSGGLIYPGDPEIRIEAHRSIASGDPANVSVLTLGSHSGTHVDAPSHFLESGGTVDELAVERLVGPAVVLNLLGDTPEIGAAELVAHDLRGCRRVLLRTRNSALLRRGEFSREYRALAPDGAAYLADGGVELVGIDYLSVERFDSDIYPVHHLLLERGVVIVEGLDLSEVPPGVYQLVCLPLRLAKLDGAPARAVLFEE
jgi:arylformamidase